MIGNPRSKQALSIKAVICACLVVVPIYSVTRLRRSGTSNPLSNGLFRSADSPATLTRNVYIDIGANWGNSLNLGQRLLPSSDLPWHVVAFEASPYISAHTEKVISAKNAKTAPPKLPYPSSGSSKDLRRFTKGTKCSPRAAVNTLRVCMLKAYRKELLATQTNPRLNSSKLIAARLDEVCNPLVPQTKGVRYTFVPAAAGAKEGWMEVKQSLLQLMIGGVVAGGLEGTKNIGTNAFLRTVSVRVVNVVQWMTSCLKPTDRIVIKLDCEGCEFQVVPPLVASKALNIEIIAMECHNGKGGSCVKLDQLLDSSGVRSMKEGQDYEGWEK